MFVRTHVAALTAVLATVGCASVPPRTEWVEARPLEIGGRPGVSAADRDYANAVAAIGRRDYAAALERLQFARARAPNDVRVFNAFGVVYDKLGRFDLSSRYYAQAAALQPSSPVVAANVAYSAVLEQGIAQPVEGVLLAQAEPQAKRVAPPATKPEEALVARRPVEAALPRSHATPARPVRLAALSGPPAPPTALASARPRLSDPPAAPEPVPTVSATVPIVAKKLRVGVESASRPVATASPKLVKPPTLAALPATTAPRAKPAVLLHPAVTPAAGQLAAVPRAIEPTPATTAQPPLGAGPPIRLARIAPAPPTQRPPVLQLAAAQPTSKAVVRLASTTTSPRRLPLLTGSTLRVIDASGRHAGGLPVVTRLARLGWSVPRSTQVGPMQSQTSIVYPARNAAVAYALARTLPYKVQLVNCASRCDRIRLVVGADALGWGRGRSAGSIVRAKAA